MQDRRRSNDFDKQQVTVTFNECLFGLYILASLIFAPSIILWFFE